MCCGLSSCVSYNNAPITTVLYFRNDRLREAADCIEDIMDKCRGTTDQEQMLQQLIDKDKLLDTVDYFCRNFRGK